MFDFYNVLYMFLKKGLNFLKKLLWRKINISFFIFYAWKYGSGGIEFLS